MKHSTATTIVAAILAAVVFHFPSLFLNRVSGEVCFAAETVYTDVLEDLRSDTSFKANEKPLVENDYSIEVFQIAESSDGELFIYTYQPCGQTYNLSLTTVRISTTSPSEEIIPYDYPLTLLSSSGVYFKYLVNGLTVDTTSAERHYSIIAIHRLFDANIDDSLNNDNVSDEVVYGVGKYWTACDVDGKTSYSYVYDDVVTVTAKYVARARYDGIGDLNSATAVDDWIVAFSTDHDIDTLCSVYGTYLYQTQHTYYNTLTGKEITASEPEALPFNISADDSYTTVINDGLFGWIFKHNYTWHLIESVSSYVARESLTDEAAAALADKQWVLHFTQTDYTKIWTQNDYYYTETTDEAVISEVTILKLNFKTNGKAYSLGVVDNKQTGDDIINTTPDHLPFWIVAIIIAVAVIFLGVIGVKISNAVENANKKTTSQRRKE